MGQPGQHFTKSPTAFAFGARFPETVVPVVPPRSRFLPVVCFHRDRKLGLGQRDNSGHRFPQNSYTRKFREKFTENPVQPCPVVHPLRFATLSKAASGTREKAPGGESIFTLEVT